MLTNEANTLLRYADEGNHWHVSVLDGTLDLACSGKAADPKPDWLHLILDVAKVGGHLTAIPHPPPMAILWFEVNDSLELQHFHDWD